MIKIANTGIKLFRLSLITIVLCLAYLFLYEYTKNINTQEYLEQNIIQIQENKLAEEVKIEDARKEGNVTQNNIWQIEIEKISLIANIKEGTTPEILNKNVGHFKITQKETGNIGLAAHNRGYEVNHFENLRLLTKGDEIKYKYNDYEATYVVIKNRIIKDTDWEYLENTEENMLTLITCVENEPQYRRCVQAIEKEKEEIY